MENNNNEIWQPVPGFENYEASSLGRIRSLNYGGTGKTKVMKTSLSNKGYLLVTLSNNGDSNRFSIHRLIYFTFNGPIPPGMTVDHVNGIRTDNRLENLQLLSGADNTRKSWKGKKHTVETKMKISAAHKGKLLSEEHKAKLSAAKKGKKRKPLSEETKAKISAAHKARYQREKNPE